MGSVAYTLETTSAPSVENPDTEHQSTGRIARFPRWKQEPQLVLCKLRLTHKRALVGLIENPIEDPENRCFAAVIRTYQQSEAIGERQSRVSETSEIRELNGSKLKLATHVCNRRGCRARRPVA
jgi:hypothetical protein